jgi:hypothetical protein
MPMARAPRAFEGSADSGHLAHPHFDNAKVPGTVMSDAASDQQVLYSITKHAMRRSADEIGATSISFRPKVFSDPASIVD